MRAKSSSSSSPATYGSLLSTVREAFVHGMDAALLVSAGIAVAGAILALGFLPRQVQAAEAASEGQRSV